MTDVFWAVSIMLFVSKWFKWWHVVSETHFLHNDPTIQRWYAIIEASQMHTRDKITHLFHGRLFNTYREVIICFQNNVLCTPINLLLPDKLKSCVNFMRCFQQLLKYILKPYVGNTRDFIHADNIPTEMFYHTISRTSRSLPRIIVNRKPKKLRSVKVYRRTFIFFIFFPALVHLNI